jgi:hypothetical protein
MAAVQFYSPKSFCPFCKTEYQEYGLHIFTEHPISCEHVLASFDEYSGGTLGEEKDERVICHLSKCSPCYDELTLYIAAKIKERTEQLKKR